MIEHLQLKELNISVFKAAKKGNWCSGDDYFVFRNDDYVVCTVADGLGSGEEAMSASSKAMEVVKQNHDQDVATMLERCNAKMMGTRGVVITILKINFKEKMVEYINVGNIVASFYDPSGELYRPIPLRGYLSGKKMKFQPQQIPYKDDMIFLLYSDGLLFTPNFHHFISKHDSTEKMIERILAMVEDSNDDTTILVGKLKQMN